MRPLLARVRRSAGLWKMRVPLWLTRGALALLYSSGHAYIFESLRHKQWFYRARGPVFNQRHLLGTAKLAEPVDLDIASRLIAAWRFAQDQAESGEPTGIWTESQQEASSLVEAVRRADPEQLATMLTGMFHSKFIQGMAHGSRHQEWASSPILVPMTIEDRLVSLAEALGVVRAETCEQGECAAAAREGLDVIVARLERHLGYSLAFPDVGAPSGIRVAGVFLTMRSVEHVYTVSRISRALQLSARPGGAPIDAVEIGGGYGGLCYWMARHFGESLRRYTLIDLPWVNLVQGYFLSKALGCDSVSFAGEPARLIVVLPASDAQWRRIPPVSLIINQDSLPEMAAPVARDYLRWIGTQHEALFFSYQQESGSAFNRVAQNVVHELTSGEPTLSLLSRDLSWTRDGYTEELYRVA